MKGMISMILIGALALTLSGCHAPVDTSAPTQTRETTVPTAAEAPPETAPVGIERPEPEDADFVRVRDYLPDVLQELPYAGTENFTGHRIYEFTEVFLRYGTVKKLLCAQNELSGRGLSLKIWDAYRPVSAQFKLWEICPNPVYVSDPNNGYSKHSRANTVDITLVTDTGKSIPMPSGFDDFTSLADRDYSDVSAEAAENARLLENVMVENGFVPYSGEWWHYSDSVSYDVYE